MLTESNANVHMVIAAALSAAVALSSLPANAQSAPPSAVLSEGSRFSEISGEQLYADVCRGCHMADAKGATGAGAYPSLAGNRNLEALGYPLALVLNGQRGMPAFGAMMSNDQAAAIVNYLRTHFGNNYKDAATAVDARDTRR